MRTCYGSLQGLTRKNAARVGDNTPKGATKALQFPPTVLYGFRESCAAAPPPRNRQLLSHRFRLNFLYSRRWLRPGQSLHCRPAAQLACP